MKTRTLAAVARATQGRLVGADASFGVVSTDTRTLPAGALYVAIRGERFDGNDFVAKAAEEGAAGALVSRLAESALPQVHVADTRAAFAALAQAWRASFAIPAVAITGSSGKTTVKELVAAILGVKRSVCVTQGSLNNDIGVPLTLMRLEASHAALVVELGANHAGEIDALARIAQPTVGVITNAGPAHLEGFGSLEGVVVAKGELLDHLPKAGTAVINADDPFRGDWLARAPCDAVTFGFSAQADCRAESEPAFDSGGSRFAMRLPSGERVDVELPLLGRQNVANALAAAAAAEAAGASPDDVVAGLARATPVRGRLKALAGRAGATVVDDSYNANPGSVRAALDFLASQEGLRIMAFGDMGELGADAVELHREIGRYARGRCDRFVAVGPLAAEAAAAFGTEARAVADVDAARAVIEPELAPGVTVLVKASRSARLERLVQALAEPSSC